MANIRDIPGLIDPAFVDKDTFSPNGGGTIHLSGDGLKINATQIDDDLYVVGEYIVNGNGDILGTK